MPSTLALIRVLLLACLVSSSHCGYLSSSLVILVRLLQDQFPNGFSQSHMLEFGNQLIHDYFPNEPYPMFESLQFSAGDSNTAKRLFQHLGFRHTSIDYNGQDGALKLDVRADLSSFLVDRYDAITNIGFSEHVGEGDVESNLVANQHAVFRTFHSAGVPSTLYFHEVPATGNWRLHGVCGYEPIFFTSLAQANGYEVLISDYSDHHSDSFGGMKGSTVVVAAYRKVTDKPFMSLGEFSKLPGLVSTFAERHSVTLTLSSESGEKVQYLTGNLAVAGGFQGEVDKICSLVNNEGNEACMKYIAELLKEELVKVDVSKLTIADP